MYLEAKGICGGCLGGKETTFIIFHAVDNLCMSCWPA